MKLSQLEQKYEKYKGRRINKDQLLDIIETIEKGYDGYKPVIKAGKLVGNDWSANIFIDIQKTKIEIYTRVFKEYLNGSGKPFYHLKKVKFTFRLNFEMTPGITVGACMNYLKNIMNVPVQDVKDYNIARKEIKNAVDGKPLSYRRTIGSASPIKESNNNKFGGKDTYAYEYDMSSAYLQVMADIRFPKLETCQVNTCPKSNQIGFFKAGPLMVGQRLKFVYGPSDIKCDYVFDLTDDKPAHDSALKLLDKIMNEKDDQKKLNLKSIPRYSVGQLQNINPFLRCMIVNTCTDIIEGFKKGHEDECIYWNTDSLVTTVERPDIINSKWIFKLKHKGIFRLAKDTMMYQWDDELPIISGITKRYIDLYNKTHDIPWRLNRDEIPHEFMTDYTAKLIDGHLRVYENVFTKDGKIKFKKLTRSKEYEEKKNNSQEKYWQILIKD